MNHSTRALVVVFGIAAALLGAGHAVGTILQGNVDPETLIYPTWPDAPAFELLGGAPAITVIPNLFGAGFVTLLVCSAVIMWMVVSVHRPWGWLGLLVLTATLLLVGGGFGPSAIALCATMAATRIRSGLTLWRKRGESLRRGVGWFFPVFFALSLLAIVFLFPGLVLLGGIMQFNEESAVLIAAATGVGSLLLSIVAGLARDSLRAVDQEPAD